jgi:hypothetical protein
VELGRAASREYPAVDGTIDRLPVPAVRFQEQPLSTEAMDDDHRLRTGGIRRLGESLTEEVLKQPVRQAVHEALDEATVSRTSDDTTSRSGTLDGIPYRSILFVIGVTAVTLYRRHTAPSRE